MASRQVSLFVALSITGAAATAALVLRLVARRITKVSLWWDDFMCMGAYVFGMAWSALLLVWVTFGFGLSLNEIPLDPKVAVSNALFFCYLAEIVYALSLSFSKLAVLAFYWRMFRTSSIKVPILTLVVLTIIWLLARTFIAIFHCYPVQAFWDRSIPDFRCYIDDSKFFFGSVLAHFVLDVAILVLPVLQVRKLQLRTAQKVGVISLFMFGILVCIASIVVVAYSITYDTSSPEVSWNVAPIMIWASVEVNLAIVSACLPMLRPIFMRVFARLFPHATLGSSDRPQPSKSRSYPMSKLRNKGATSNDTESTRKLAYTELEPKSYEESHHFIRGHGHRGPQVTITGRPSDEQETSRVGSPPLGILVRSETSVKVSHANDLRE